MSRYYEMHLRVYEANPDRVDAIKQAAAEEWPFVQQHPIAVRLDGAEPGVVAESRNG